MKRLRVRNQEGRREKKGGKRKEGKNESRVTSGHQSDHHEH